MLIEGLRKDLPDESLPKPLQRAEHTRKSLHRGLRQAIVGDADPFHQKIVVSVWLPLHLLEKLGSLGDVELFA